MDMKAPRTVNRLTNREVIALTDALRNAVTTEGNVTRYLPTMNDKRIARDLHITTQNVKGLRQILFPNFIAKERKPHAKKAVAVSVADTTALEHSIAELQKQLVNVQYRLSHLERELGITMDKTV